MRSGEGNTAALLVHNKTIKGGVPMTTDVEKWVQGEDAAWASRDAEKMLSFYTDDCLYEDLAAEITCHGKEEIRAFFKDALIAFPDFKVEVTSFFASGNHVCIEGVIGGTHTGNIPRLPPATGKAFSVRCAHICELRGDKASRVTDYYNRVTILRH
jgi:steroid delta-isomerase-like uncharacterized protein